MIVPRLAYAALFALACALHLAPANSATVNDDAREVLDLAEAAALLRVAPDQVRELAQAHQLPGRLIGELWRFSRSGLLAWLSGRDFESAPLPAQALTDGESALSGRGKSPTTAAVGAAEQVATASPPGGGAGNERPQTEIAQIGGGATARPSVPSSGAQAPPPATEAPTLGVRPSSPTAQEIALRDQRSLLPRGQGSVELGVSYAHAEEELFPVARQEQRSIGASATFRYGLADGLQAVVAVPGVRDRRTTYTDGLISGTAQRQETAGSHWGDASVSLLGVILREASWRPNLILSLDAVLPSGPGDRGLGAGLALSKSFDPAVIFGSVSYLRGLAIDASNSKRSLARDNWGFSFGYTYALNDALALNSVFTGIYRNADPADPSSIPPPSERYQLQLGMTWMLGRGIFVEPAVAMRVGGATPDLTVSADLILSF